MGWDGIGICACKLLRRMLRIVQQQVYGRHLHSRGGRHPQGGRVNVEVEAVNDRPGLGRGATILHS